MDKVKCMDGKELCTEQNYDKGFARNIDAEASSILRDDVRCGEHDDVRCGEHDDVRCGEHDDVRCGEEESISMEAVIKKHGGLVKTIALKLYKIYGEDLDDVMQIGYIGLIKAAERYDPTRGLAFSTYACPTIAGEIRSQLRDKGAIKVSRDLKADIFLLRRAENAYQMRFGTSPKISDLVKETGLSQERIAEVLQADDAINNMEDFETANIWQDEEEKNVERIDVRDGIKSLSKKEQQIISLRYYKDMTQQQVAKLMGISQVQVCRIEKKSLKLIKDKIEVKKTI